MGESTLLVDRRGARVDLEPARTVVLRNPDGSSHRVGLRALARIIVTGDAKLSASLLRAADDAGVAVMLLPGRGGDRGRFLFPTAQGAGDLRHSQHLCHARASSRVAIARDLVVAKLRGQQNMLNRFGLGYNLERFIEDAGRAADLQRLRGLEGAGGARYFRAWRESWPADWGFTERNRRPPRDPLNALLSLGYSLAGHYVGRLAVHRGLEIGLGFLHEPGPGREALLFDLVEPLRPVVDTWIWARCGMGLVSTGDFACSRKEGCRLTKEARGRFFGAWFAKEQQWLQPEAHSAVDKLIQGIRQEEKKNSQIGPEPVTSQ